jgi:SMC interacting uncharacterized protein involved in chromosome segregation
MTRANEINLKFKEFFAEKNYQISKSLANDILNSLNEIRYPVYTSLKNNETPYDKLFDNYFEGFYSEINPNTDALKIIHNFLLTDVSR